MQAILSQPKCVDILTFTAVDLSVLIYCQAVALEVMFGIITLRWRPNESDGVSTIYSGADQRKLQSCASLAFVRGIHRWPMNSTHKGQVTRKMFSFDDVIIGDGILIVSYIDIVSTVFTKGTPSAKRVVPGWHVRLGKPHQREITGQTRKTSPTSLVWPVISSWWFQQTTFRRWCRSRFPLQHHALFLS